jgi:hypothetical protein
MRPSEFQDWFVFFRVEGITRGVDLRRNGPEQVG